MIEPFVERSIHEYHNLSYGLGPASYDLRIDNNIELKPMEFSLASTFEKVRIPNNLIAFIKDKSTWIRKGLALQNTLIDPGFSGHIVLELTNHGYDVIQLKVGMPICQIVFHRLDEPTEKPYAGKYNEQPRGVTGAR
jgi:dCTP deaminase